MHTIAQIKDLPDILTSKELSSIFQDKDYLAIMCHEIGTPLSAIIGLSEILGSGECDPQKQLECSQMLRDSSHMLMALMKNILDYFKIGAGMVEIEKIDFSPVKVLQEAMHIIATKAEEKNLDLHVHIAEGIPSQCIGDPLRLRQILLNLLSNAVKFTEKGHVSAYMTVSIDSSGKEQLCIIVVDTGIGISKDSLEKIFYKYTQESASITRTYGGTGLGLAISQELVHLMGGAISVKSWPLMGSHFTVTLPLNKAPDYNPQIILMEDV